MRFLLLVALFFITGFSVVPTGLCPTSRENLKQCISELLDTNIDGEISLQELDNFISGPMLSCISNRPEFTSLVTSASVMSLCDVNSDNVLNGTDWSASNACLQKYPIQDWVCRACYMCGWSGPQ